MNKVCPDVKQAIDGRFVGFQLKNSQQVEAKQNRWLVPFQPLPTVLHLQRNPWCRRGI